MNDRFPASSNSSAAVNDGQGADHRGEQDGFSVCGPGSQSLPRRTCSLRKGRAILPKPFCNCQGERRFPTVLAREPFALYGSLMESSAKPQVKKAAEIFVLHCLNPQC